MSDGGAGVWYLDHFDHLAPEFGEHFDSILADMRRRCPVAHSDQYGGFWVATRYEDVLTVLQDWHTFSSAEKVSISNASSSARVIPQEVDPPLHRVFRRLLNVHLTPDVIAPYEDPTRRLVTRLIDDFVETGCCEFMAAFADQLPRLSFFELVMHAPTADIAWLNEMTHIADSAGAHPGVQEAWASLHEWMNAFVEKRQDEPPLGDIVDSVIGAEIDGRPITREEVLGVITLLIFGGFGTTASALGHIMVRFASDPAVPARMRSRPDLIPAAVEEFLRIDTPVVSLARTATRDVVLGGQQFEKGDKVLFHLASANRDDAQFENPTTLELDRSGNRHLAFGAGPHRCAGSNLARLNLRVAIEEVTARLDGIRLEEGAGPIEYRTAFTRAPLAVPIVFTPGPRRLPRIPDDRGDVR